MNMAFTDGTKFEDISKVHITISLPFIVILMPPQLLIFVAYNLVPWDKKEGWCLLRCLHSFAIVDLYLSFEVHMEQTLAAGQCELSNFAQRMRVCIPFISSMLFIHEYLLFVLARNILMYLMRHQKARANMGNHGTFQKCTH